MRRAIIVIATAAIIALAVIYVVFNQRAERSEGGPYGPPSSNDGATVRYKTANFIDSQGIGTKAFSMLIPSDWQSQGTISWIFDNPAMPVAGDFRAWNPSGSEEFHLFPNQAFFWSDNPMIKQTFPPGSRYFGALVHTPLGPIDALKEIALPMFRGDVRNMEIISEEELHQVKEYFETGTDATTGITTTADGGKIRVEYTLDGVAMEDELCCIIQSTQFPVQTIFGTFTNINWYMTYIESFRAEKGQLDSQSKMFQTISYFARTDVKWLNKYNQVVEYLIQKQIQQIQSLGQLSSIVSQTSNEISDENFRAWQQNQNIKDQIADDFSDSILGVQSYRNPIDGSTVDLPSGYGSVWANSLGEYILSDSASYNPNTESNLNWEQLTEE